MGPSTLIGAPPNLMMATTLGIDSKHMSTHMAPIVFICTVLFLGIHYLKHRRWLQTISNYSTGIVLPFAPFSEKKSLFHRFLKLDYETLVFFAGLFILVGSLDHVGLFQTLAHTLTKVQNPLGLMLAVLWGAAAASAFVDNVPMALAMAYVIKPLAAISPSFPSGILVWAALIGLTLGGMMTPIGASPNIVAYGILEKQGIRIGWKTWGSEEHTS